MTQKTPYHFIGIGGIGMSALARIILEKRHFVTGSDLAENANTSALSQKGASIRIGHSASYISPEATIVYSSDIQKSNPEFQAAVALKCKMLHRSDLLAMLMQEKKALAIAGSHGKTTTTSLLTMVLEYAEQDPPFAVGGLIQGVNGRWGSGDYFVAEADESDGTFLSYHPLGAIVTNVGLEHMNHYESEERLHKAFEQFMGQVQDPSLLFFCGDDPHLVKCSQGRGISYGYGPNCMLRITRFLQKGWQTVIDCEFKGKAYQEIMIPLVGEYNALNGLAVFGLCLALGMDEEVIREGLKRFPGVGRRCEKRGEYREVLLIDDYGHHPTEVQKTLFAIREAIGERRLLVIFQPHRYTRLRDHLKKFAKCFECVDHLFVTDIYSAGETPLPGVTVEALIEEIKKQSTIAVSPIPKESAVQEIHGQLRPHDVVVTVGAGDITHFHKDLSRYLESSPPKKYTLGLIFGGKSCEHEISLKSARFVDSSLQRELYAAITTRLIGKSC